MPPEAGYQGANALWLSQPHHPEGTAAPQHTREASQWRRASPPHPGGEREVSARSSISLIGNGGISGAWPIGIWPQHLFQLIWPKSGCLPLHLSPSEQVYRGERDQWQEPLAWGAPRQESPVEELQSSQYKAHLGLPQGLRPACTTPLGTRLALAVATWAMVPQSNGGTPGHGLFR